FLSMRADAVPDTETRGLSVFTLSEQASDREAAALARSENRADLVGGISLVRQPREIGNVLMDLARRQTNNLSIVLARKVVDQLVREAMLLDHPRPRPGVAGLPARDRAGFLVELGGRSTRREGRLLQQPASQQKLARGLARAVEAYFAAHPSG